MTPFLALLAVLLDSVISVPHSDWREYEIKVTDANSYLECTFEVQDTAAGIAVRLLHKSDVERFRRGRSTRPLYSTSFTHSGGFRYRLEQPGDYMLVFDNRLEGRRDTAVKVDLRLTAPRSVRVQTVPAGKRTVIIVLSVLFFLSVSLYAVRRFVG